MDTVCSTSTAAAVPGTTVVVYAVPQSTML